jgi:hypothetical protein
MRIVKLLLLVLIVAASSVFAEKGIYTEQKTHMPGIMGQPARDEIAKSWISDTGYRVETGNSIMIFRFDTKKMYSIDLDKKVYVESNADDMKQMAMMGKAMMDNGEDGGFQFKKTGETKTIKGWECYKVSAQNAMMKQSMWLTEDLPYGKETYYKFYKKVPEFEELAESFYNSEEVKGYPVATEVEMNMMGMQIKSSSELISIDEKDIPASIYNLPDGLEKVDNPMKNMGRPQPPKLQQ